MILQDLKGVVHYFDDIIVCGKTQEEHDEKLPALEVCFKQNNIFITKSKCTFNTGVIKYLGFIISKNGVKADDCFTSRTTSCEVLEDGKELQSFLGTVGFYSSFLVNYAELVEPLLKCLHSDNDFTWGKSKDLCFKNIKEHLASSPVLKISDPNHSTEISTDASNIGVGATLDQIDKSGNDHAVAFASRKLSETEKHYSTIEKQALDCVWAISKYRQYLWGVHFPLRTDHKPLIPLFSSKSLGWASAWLDRWKTQLLPYNFICKY